MDLAISTALDLIIVSILVVSIVFGVRRGLIRSVIGLFGSIVALVLALVFSANLGSYIDANYINAPMREWLIGQLSASASDVDVSSSEIPFDDLFADRPEFFVDTCEFLNIDLDEIAKTYETLKNEGVDQAKSAIITTMVDPLSAVISRVIAFAVIYIAAILIISIITLFSKFLTNLPIIRHLDKLGGGALGALSGVLMVFIIVAIVSAGSKYALRDRTAEERQQIVDQTIVYKIFYRYDPLVNLFGAE